MFCTPIHLSDSFGYNLHFRLYFLHNDKFYFWYLKKNADKNNILFFKLDFECRTFTCSGILSQCGIATFSQVKESNTSSTTDMGRQNLFEIQVSVLFQTLD